MTKTGNQDKDRVIAGLVRDETPPREEPTVPDAYCNAVHEVVRYLANYGANPPPLATMGLDERRRYIAGYALPLFLSGIPVDVLLKAAVRFQCRGGAYFPRNPGELLDCARAVIAELAPGWKPPAALERPSISREEWIEISNSKREKFGLPLLGEAGSCGAVDSIVERELRDAERLRQREERRAARSVGRIGEPSGHARELQGGHA